MATDIHSITLPLTCYIKDVRRNPETRAWEAYVIRPDGAEIHLGSRERSWDAEELCDAYLLAQLQRLPATEETEPLPALEFPTEVDEDGCWQLELGVIDGCTVLGRYYLAELYSAELTWRGCLLSTDGYTYLGLPASGDCDGQMRLDEWEWTKELVRSGAADRLIALARRCANMPLLPSASTPTAVGLCPWTSR